MLSIMSAMLNCELLLDEDDTVDLLSSVSAGAVVPELVLSVFLVLLPFQQVQ